MGNLSEFLHMGGYGAYIWPAYGVSALVLFALLVSSIGGLRADEKTLETLQAQNGGRRRRRRETTDEEENSENGDQA